MKRFSLLFLTKNQLKHKSKIAHALARVLGAKTLKIKLSDIEYKTKKSGAPYLFDKAHGKIIYTSITHTKNLIIAAISNKPVGIDVEYICERKNYKAISKRFFDKDIENTLDFLKLWTSFEAKAKKSEKGIAGGFDIVNNDDKIKFYTHKGFLICLAYE